MPRSSICQARASTGRVSSLAMRRRALGRGGGDAQAGGGLGRHLQPRQPVADLEQILRHGDRVSAQGVEPAEALQRSLGVAAHHRVEQVEQLQPVAEAQHRLDQLAVHGPLGGGDRLVEQGQRVAHGALCGARHHGQRIGCDRDAFLGADAGEVRGQFLGLDPAQLEFLAARQDGDRDLAHLGGGEDELGVRRRLLDRLEQRIPGLGREHVHLVQDVDLVARGAGQELQAFEQLQHVLLAGLRGRVHLDHVERPVLVDRPAAGADAAGLGRRPALTVGAGAVQARGR